MRGAGLLAAMLLLPLLTLAAAQQHEHMGEAMVVVAHDTAPDGRAVVGDVTHFAAVLFGADGNPAFHNDLTVRVELNGVLLFATTPESGHDYDGIYGFDVVFPVPGTYTVTAIMAGEEGEVTGTFQGYVEAVTQPVEATLQLEGPASAMAGEPVTFTYHVQDAQGQLLPHTDAILEVREAPYNPVFLRVHTHTHEDPMSLQFAFPAAGSYDVHVLAYTAFPEKGVAQFPAFVTTQRVEVAAAPAPALPMPMLAPPSTDRNRVEAGEAAEPYRLLAAYDPYTIVGPFSQSRLSALVVDADMALVQHVDFRATLTDSLGRTVFASESLHEYDGILEVLVGAQLPGQYHLVVEASRGDWSGQVASHYLVAPPVLPLSAGPQFVEAMGLDALAAGVPGEVVLAIRDAAGRPFAHGEVDVQVLPAAAGAAPLLATKLHTHATGDFPFTLALPAAGPYVLRLAPFSLEPRPALAGVGQALDLPFEVAAGEPFPLPPQPIAAASEEAPARVPGLGAGVLLGALAGLAVALRRRP